MGSRNDTLPGHLTRRTNFASGSSNGPLFWTVCGTSPTRAWHAWPESCLTPWCGDTLPFSSLTESAGFRLPGSWTGIGVEGGRVPRSVQSSARQGCNCASDWTHRDRRGNERGPGRVSVHWVHRRHYCARWHHYADHSGDQRLHQRLNDAPHHFRASRWCPVHPTPPCPL